ncbi:hypothetical protein BH11CYA1_BH11CYA1_48010 [soil metagenome]
MSTQRAERYMFSQVRKGNPQRGIMSNLVITYGIASSVALSLLLGLPANAADKAKSGGQPHTQSRVVPLACVPGKDKIVQPTGISKVVKESNHQALKLLASLTKREKRDVVISPAASTAAYLLLLNGLRGTSRVELAQAMKVDQISDEQLANTTATYLKSLSSSAPKCEVGVAGATNAPFSFQLKYVKLLHDKFGGLALNDTEHGLNKLRDYLSRKTDGRFGGAVQSPAPGVIDLYSTLYFNGDWADKFQTTDTKIEGFNKADGTTVMVPMMHQFYGCLHLSGKNFQALRMPYQSSNDRNNVFDAMYIILPNKGIPLQKLLEELSNTGFDAYSSGWRNKVGTLSIPRFKIDSNELVIPLPMNNGKGINLSKANLGAMCQNSTSPRDIETKQWTSLDFNENGTIAASLVQIAITLGGKKIEQFNMKVDRPFAFVLGNSRTGTFLFAGAVQDPKDSKMPFAQAEQEWLKRLAAINKKDSISYGRMVQDLAKFYRSEGKLSQAEVVLTEASKTVEPDPFIQADVLYDLAQLLFEEKRYKNADQVYRQLLAIQKRHLEDHSSFSSPIYSYKTYLESYAHLVSLMKANPSYVHKEQELLYKGFVISALENFGEQPASDSGLQANAVDQIVDAKVQLAELYTSAGNKEGARDTYKSAIASVFASPQPNYCRAIKIGKTYLKLLKDAKLFDWEYRKTQSDLDTWTSKINPSAKGTGQRKQLSSAKKISIFAAVVKIRKGDKIQKRMIVEQLVPDSIDYQRVVQLSRLIIGQRPNHDLPVHKIIEESDFFDLPGIRIPFVVTMKEIPAGAVFKKSDLTLWHNIYFKPVPISARGRLTSISSVVGKKARTNLSEGHELTEHDINP